MEIKEKKAVFRWAAIISYVIGFIYIKYMAWGAGVCDVPFLQNRYGIRMLGFAVIFLICTEIFANKVGVTYQSIAEKKNSMYEPIIFVGCIILQSIGLALWNFHDDWEFYQIFLWHFTIIYYVLARTGSLAAGRSGILFIVDCFQGFIAIPITNIFLRIIAIFKREEKPEDAYDVAPKKKNFAKTVFTIVISVFIAFCVCLYAFVQLSEASETFRKVGEKFLEALDEFFTQKFWDYTVENIIYIIASIPVSWFLFSLVGGALNKSMPFITEESFEKETKGCHQLPAYSAYIVIGSVCFLYTLFLGTSIYDFINHKGLFAATAHEASVRAVGSFWSLIRVVLLNFAILAGSCFLSKKALWEEKATRILATVLFVFALGFAILAACNLMGVYIAIFGITPKRILSSWVVMNVIVWCFLMIIRFYKKIPAAQIGIILAAVSFSIVVCFRF
ncbi:DUF4153 domain-containing protein [Butyrivibrio sp. VCB2006]|uniref:DUF4153 domain-containing protein n=1 Tax=Butyrivibrio sp. VCB2006 TaxID=1280679 RepID=UPI00040763F3|nr:DUF4153 domain-containing protein [Butyrivibrio sp. VCB2006]